MHFTINDSLLCLQQVTPAPVLAQPEEDEADYEEMGVAETYAEYWPAKCE